jgi:hypothetical protein
MGAGKGGCLLKAAGDPEIAQRFFADSADELTAHAMARVRRRLVDGNLHTARLQGDPERKPR